MYYHCRIAEPEGLVGGKYVAAIEGRNAQALYAASHRSRIGKSNNEGISEGSIENNFLRFISNARSRFTKPALESVLDQVTALSYTQHSRSVSAHRVEALLLAAQGMSAQAASDVTQLPYEIVLPAITDFERRTSELGINRQSKDQVSLLASSLSDQTNIASKVTRSYANWLVANRQMLQRATASFFTSFNPSGALLELKNEHQLRDLLPTLGAFPKLGLQPVFRLATGKLLDSFKGLEAALIDSSIAIHENNVKSDGIGTLSFLFKADLEAHKPKVTKAVAGPEDVAHPVPRVAVPRASPRSYGRAGRLAVAGLIAGLSL